MIALGDDIVLASDGYPFLEPTLDQSERALAELKASDPHLISRFPTTKGFEPGLDSFDDRAYLRFAVAPPRTHKLKRLRRALMKVLMQNRFCWK